MSFLLIIVNYQRGEYVVVKNRYTGEKLSGSLEDFPDFLEYFAERVG